MTRFLHAADIHIDSPLKNLQRYDGAPVEFMRKATRRALENLVRLAIDRSVHFVLIAGDLFDRDWKDYNTGLYFVSQMARLRAENIPVILITGNHDAAGRISRTLRYPENVRVLSDEAPETVIMDRGRAAVHGRGYPGPAVTENLVKAYPPPVPGYVNIGLLHTSLDGREGHDPYAPCSVDDLTAAGYDYWALGHVHEREIIRRDPWIVFPGNIQGRHARETGPRGCMEVTLGEGSDRVQFHALDVFRWVEMTVDLSGIDAEEDLPDLLRERLVAESAEHSGHPLAVRIRLTGETDFHDRLAADPEHWVNQIRAAASDAGHGRIWIEKVLRATAPNRPSPGITEGPLKSLAEIIERARAEPGIREILRWSVRDLSKKLPREVLQAAEGFRPEDDAWLDGMVADARPLLMRKLFTKDGEP